MSAGVTRKSRIYLHEIDMVRVVTALSVIAVHAVAFTVVFNSTNLGVQLQNGAVSALHFTRELFLTLTAFVMVHNYTKRPLKLSTFWRKRGLGVVVPYIVWSLFYVWFNVSRDPFGAWIHTALADILTGNASYQLYYILLTIEFYLMLPLLLWFVKRYGQRPWRILAVSFVLQMALMYFDFNYLERGAFGANGFAQWINDYQWRMLPAYQFYVLLGAVGALYLDPLRAFVQRHGKLVVLGLVGGLGLLWLRYAQAIWLDHQDVGYATQVFQPVMVIYSTTATLFLYWLGIVWSSHRSKKGVPYGHPLAKLLSDGSFGIYLIHAFILNDVLLHLAPRLPADWPVVIRVFGVWFTVAVITSTICIVMLYTPGLSRLIGRPCALPPDFGPWRWALEKAAALRATSSLARERLHSSPPRPQKPVSGTTTKTMDEIVRVED
jgi:probable poly-beta-1,6-N-acetyl-D-glucosamine export protein